MTKKDALVSQFERTVVNLREVLTKLETAKKDRAVLRDSAVKRFEIAFDSCWKTLKEKLRNEHGVDVLSPKKVFQEAFKQGIIENENIWLDITDTRNETSHTYNEEMAEKVLASLPKACSTMEKLLWKLKK